MIAGDPKLSHSNTLLQRHQPMSAQANAAVQDVQLFAATSGPGSFTGLRIGLATIKALAATLNRPCVGVPTLHVIAHTAGVSKATVSLLPAGRGEVFVQSFSVAGGVTELDAASHLPPALAIERYRALSALKVGWFRAQSYSETLIESAARELGFAFQVVDVNDPETSGRWLVTNIARNEFGKTCRRNRLAKVSARGSGAGGDFDCNLCTSFGC